VEALVRRSLIALVGATLQSPAPRYVKSPAFARRIDRAPAAVRDAIAARLAQLKVSLPAEPPEPPRAVDARALRAVLASLQSLASRNAEVPERIVQAYRAQGATAHEVATAILSEFALEGGEAILEVARALDQASELLGHTWQPANLRLALERELFAEARGTAGEPQAVSVAAAEAQRPLPGRRHFSASSLNLYADCPRKWYFRYLCGAVEDKPTSASAYGTAFHAALEAFHRVYARVGGVAARELELRLEGEINTAFEQHRIHFGSEVEFRLNRRRAQRTAKKYLAWLRNRAEKEPFEVIGCEIKADMNLDGVEFRGFIDRVDRDTKSGRVTVFDYKTGSIAESAAEYRNKIKDRKEFQLPYYYWARTLAGDTVRSLALVPLREAHLDVQPIELEVVPSAPPARGRDDARRGVIGAIDLERARTAMVDIARMLAAGTTPRFEPTKDPSSCRYCVYAPSCREKPAPDAQPFAR
jgi:RecB family exonuclease